MKQIRKLSLICSALVTAVFFLVGFLPQGTGQTLPAVEAVSDADAQENIESLELSFAPQLPLQPGYMSAEEKSLISEQFLNGTLTFVSDAGTTLGTINSSVSVIVPSTGVTPDALNNLYALMRQVSGAYDRTSINYVLVHWTNHVRAVGLSPNDVGGAALYAQRVIQLGVSGNGLMLYRPTTEAYQEAYLFISRVDGRLWSQLLDASGHPITGFVPNQATLNGASLKYTRDGFRILQSVDDLPPELVKNWLGRVPPTLQFYVWGIQQMVKTAALNGGYRLEQAWAATTLAALNLQLLPPMPLIINPCLLDAGVLCSPEGSRNT